MIAKPVTFTYTVDEQTNVGILDGTYVQFEEGVDAPKIITPCAACGVYAEKQLRIPDEFTEARQLVSDKIVKLQALL